MGLVVALAAPEIIEPLDVACNKSDQVVKGAGTRGANIEFQLNFLRKKSEGHTAAGVTANMENILRMTVVQLRTSQLNVLVLYA